MIGNLSLLDPVSILLPYLGGSSGGNCMDNIKMVWFSGFVAFGLPSVLQVRSDCVFSFSFWLHCLGITPGSPFKDHSDGYWEPYWVSGIEPMLAE